MPSTATAARSRPASSSSTGSRATTKASLGSGSRCRRAPARAVERNRVKRRLRESWRERLERVPAGRDYVLIARPALGEALDGRDAGWLGERLDEVLGKAAA